MSHNYISMHGSKNMKQKPIQTHPEDEGKLSHHLYVKCIYFSFEHLGLTN